MRLIFPILFLGIAGATFFLYINPTYGKLEELQAEARQYDEALNRSRELQEIRDELIARYNAFPQNGIDRLEKLVPDHIDNVRLILDFDAMASRYGMRLRNVSVEADQSRANLSIVGPDEGKYESVILSFSVAGDYDTFRQFLTDLERSLRLVDVVGISFSSNESGIYEYLVRLKTYWLKP